MPSEKSRYRERNLGPTEPITFEELRQQLPTLGADRLAEIAWSRAQYDEILRKCLMVSVAIRSARGWGNAKAAIDYAVHFPDYIRYTEGGHGQILAEIKSTLDFLKSQGQREFALRIAQYTIERAQEVAENLEDDWDWTSSLKSLTEWSQKVPSSSTR